MMLYGPMPQYTEDSGVINQSSKRILHQKILVQFWDTHEINSDGCYQN